MNALSHDSYGRFLLSAGCLAVILGLTPAVCRAKAKNAAPSAVDQLKAAQAALAEAEQNPPSTPADWSHAKDLDDASARFMAWQSAMLRERQENERKQWRQFYQKLKVPPPPTSTNQTAEEPPTVRLDIPLPFPTDAKLGLSIGEPSVSFTVGAQAKALSFLGASYKAGVSYAASDNKWLVGDCADITADFEAGPATIAGSYQFHSCTWGQPKEDEGGKASGSAELSAELYQIKGALGYNTEGELSVSAGYDFIKTPKTWGKLAEASVGVEAEVSAPVKVHGLVRGGKTLSSTIAGYSAKLAKLLTRPVDCPYCSAKGEMDCSTCGNTRSVVCPNCNGKLKFTCSRCEGGGELICTNCQQTGLETCSRCGGSGTLKCSTCHGSGQVTVYESEMQSREEPVLVSAGFDSNGNPVYETRRETRYYTVQVPKTQTCGTCGGSGSGGECGACGGDGKVTCHRCGGSGTVQCSRCGGTGMVNCGKCRGTGKVTCPDCHGRPIRCPLCKGKKELGK